MLTEDERTMLNVAISHLTAISDGSAAQHGAELMRASIALDAIRAIAAPRVATVGELLGTAPIGAVVESLSRGGWVEAVQYRPQETDPRYPGTGHTVEVRTFEDGAWSEWLRGAFNISYSVRLPARLVPLDDIDASPASRGPIGEG